MEVGLTTELMMPHFYEQNDQKTNNGAKGHKVESLYNTTVLKGKTPIPGASDESDNTRNGGSIEFVSLLDNHLAGHRITGLIDGADVVNSTLDILQIEVQ